MMTSARIFLCISLLFVLGTGVVSGPGCANIIPPQGGPRDSLPPQLEKAEPRDSALNFRGARLVFSFDEYVELQNIPQELLVTPTPRTMPVVDWRLNTVTVKIRDSLETNTTYTYQFGNAIKDLNEGNVLKNFSVTFSTGAYIDSLELRGMVVLAETGRTDSTLIVMLHSNGGDSAVVNEKPRYVARLDNKGNFVFKNLPPKTYYLYALKDEGGSRRYLNDKQVFAFADQAITISDSTPPITLYAYANLPAQPAAASALIQGPGSRIRGAAPAADRRLRFSTNLVNNLQDLLTTFTMGFEQPLRLYDSTKLTLLSDTNYLPVSGYRFVKDSTNRKLELLHTWKENTIYHLVLDKDFAEDSLGRKLLKTDTLSFRTNKLADYGELKIRFRNLDLSRKPVLIFVRDGSPRYYFPLAGNEFSQKLFLPGEYELRILFDTNGNGAWDPGNFFGEKRQPEIVKPIERKIIVRPSWENEIEIAL